MLTEVVTTQSIQQSFTPDSAVDALLEGNKRFVTQQTAGPDYSKQIALTAEGQYPFAAVVACIDSRVPVETVFDQGVGDIFTARVAGNFVNTDILGSLEFACKVAGSKAIVILGHTSCGAVKGACDNVELGNLTAMLANIEPAVQKVSAACAEGTVKSSANPEFVQSVAETNVALTIERLRQDSPLLKEMEDNGDIKVVGAMYDVATGKVSLLDA